MTRTASRALGPAARAPARRRAGVHVSTHSLVSTGHQLATRSALQVLESGGNAFDAAITASALMNVALPMSCGLGGDVAVLAYRADGGHALSLCGLGAAPAGADPDTFRRLGHRDVPRNGVRSATVPACLDAFSELSAHLGSRPLAELLEPAACAAEEGLEVTPQMAEWIWANRRVIRADAHLLQTFLPGGRVPPVGGRLRWPGLARTYRRVGESAGAWREGEALLRTSSELGGLFAAADLRRSQCAVEAPVSLRVARREVLTTPLPTQGFLLLQNLRLLELARERWPPRSAADEAHLLSEICNLTFHHRLLLAGDPRFVAGTERLLKPAFLDGLLGQVDPERRSPCRYQSHYSAGDTTSLVVVDAAGNAASIVQSLGLGFGAGVGVPDTGLIFNNRLGRSSTLREGDPNQVAPGKRPINTIAPYLVLERGRLWLAGNTPGGDGQVQWNAQFLAALLFHDEDTVRAISAPRWTYLPGGDKCEAGRPEQIEADEDCDAEMLAGLIDRGHRVTTRPDVGGAMRAGADARRWPSPGCRRRAPGGPDARDRPGRVTWGARSRRPYNGRPWHLQRPARLQTVGRATWSPSASWTRCSPVWTWGRSSRTSSPRCPVTGPGSRSSGGRCRASRTWRSSASC